MIRSGTRERGQLYTLNDAEMSNFLREFPISVLTPWIHKHIRRLFRCFPAGIAVHCFEALLYNMVQFRLSDVVPDVVEFVLRMDAMRVVEVGPDRLRCFIFQNVSPNPKHVLVRPIGYSELLIVLFAQLNTQQNRGIDGETLEKAFHARYQSRLVHEAPFIQQIIAKIADVDVDGAKYRLLPSSRKYLATQPSAFAAILRERTEPERSERQTPSSPFREDACSVFMGGFSHGTTVEDLRAELAKLGVKMLSSSGISYRNYGWSFVTLSSAADARHLMSISPIKIWGRSIDIRPFIDRERVRNHCANKPKDEAIIAALTEMLQRESDGLTLAEVQSRLFRVFHYRLDGPELTKLAGEYPTRVYVRRLRTERLFCVGVWSGKDATMDGLFVRLQAMWKRGRGGHAMEEVTLRELENEFARRYRTRIDAKVFGFESVGEVVKELRAVKGLPFTIKDEESVKEGSNVTSPGFVRSASNHSSVSSSSGAYRYSAGNVNSASMSGVASPRAPTSSESGRRVGFANRNVQNK